jgi:hypothetical protein
MRKNPERLAWIVLLTSFFTCVGLTVSLPLGIRHYVLHARRSQNVTLDVQRGTLRVQLAGRGEPIAIAEERDAIPESTVITTDATSGRLVVRAPQEDEHVTATVQIYDNTEITLLLARSPRFSASSLPHRVTLRVTTGQLRINVSSDGARETVVEVRTPHGTASLSGGSYELKVNSSTDLTVRYGEATLIAGQESIAINSDERAIANSEQHTGPLPAAPNLVVNGDFEYPLESGWTSYFRQDEDPSGTVDIITHEGRRAASFYRAGSNHAEVGVEQEINRNVHDFASLRLHLAVNLKTQDVPVCGTVGSECPVMVRIDYTDAYGQDRLWLQGFYSMPDPSAANPLVCTTCNTTRNEHIRVRPRIWYSYLSPNLIPLLSQDGEAPAAIRSIRVYASGHTYHAMVAEIELIGEK